MALAKLREVQLHDLPELTHLCKENFKRGPRFQNLETLEVWNCDRLISLVPSSVTFQNLATLDVWSCGSLVNLLPPSTAKSGSDMMKEVVSGGGGEATDEIAFCKLEHIALVCLANLTSFCSGGYTFTFPSLDHLVVEECPKMKVFSQGFSTTPRLERVDVADNEWHWEGDLNTTIQNSSFQGHLQWRYLFSVILIAPSLQQLSFFKTERYGVWASVFYSLLEIGRFRVLIFEIGHTELGCNVIVWVKVLVS
ncbi:hypothetical protein AAG906_025732 [Vitis piasezkii]